MTAAPFLSQQQKPSVRHSPFAEGTPPLMAKSFPMRLLALSPVPMLGSLVLLGGCAVAPEPIPAAEHVVQAQSDYQTIYANQPEIVGPLTAAEAVARALKYNYDHQLAMAEASLQDRQFDVTVMNLLPRLAASAGYVGRNNESASSSLSVLTRRQSLEPSTSQDQHRRTGDLTFSWNLLDFGVGYFQARQQSDRALIAVERRRRVVNNIVKEVRSAYWRAGTAQRLLPKIDPLMRQAEQALAASTEIEKNALAPILPTLEYRKNLLQVITQLRRLRSDLSVAKAQLAALINVPPTTTFTVEEPPALPNFPRSVSVDVATLELMGLSQRPELREERYQERVDRNNLYKEILRLMPGLSVLGSLNYDSNSYLVNNLWAEAGVRATLNLVNLISAPQIIDAAEAQIEVAKTRRLALSVAVLTQVNVSYQQFQRSVETYDTALEIARVEGRIAKTVNDGGLAQAEPEFERIRRGLSSVAAELDRDRAFTELQTALGNLYTSVGLDPIPASVETDDLNALRRAVKESLMRLDQGELPPLPTPATPPAAVPAGQHPAETAPDAAAAKPEGQPVS
ncbi:TolC family protein [Azospirillum sp. A1-3]|uniref:TolC family protein n=1 Tax=Azospirillum sp. A1-3 TaxID=185874 RepID=UPI002076E843|nr:TolC family protein [Azospirillum sp. A1-3]MCM8738754.1 TolC family protein [Azospirillum sp. A1-3]